MVILIEGGRDDGKRLRRRGFAQFFISLLGLSSSVLYWAGGWGLLDTYVVPNQPLASLWVTATFGILGMMFLGTSRSLHGGLSHDGREDESYPLQPYYWLAIDLPCTRKYDHLDEEQP